MLLKVKLSVQKCVFYLAIVSVYHYPTMYHVH